MEYKILSATNPNTLTSKVNDAIKDGWEIVGGHQVVEVHRQNRYADSQHMDTTIKSEYSQTIVKSNINIPYDVPSNKIT
tara:strand:+ start:186 stop:422 length:237 start_codon:yes stop_codon:yes gene_type:complete